VIGRGLVSWRGWLGMSGRIWRRLGRTVVAVEAVVDTWCGRRSRRAGAGPGRAARLEAPALLRGRASRSRTAPAAGLPAAPAKACPEICPRLRKSDLTRGHANHDEHAQNRLM
jgi:hypothetical protein